MAGVSRIVLKTIKILQPRAFLVSSRLLSDKGRPEDDTDLDQPIKYSTSKAATWKAEQSFSGIEKEDVSPWYQPLVISASIAVFLIYFGYLREENDVDQELSMSLYDRIEGLEEVQLRNAISYYEEYDKTYDTNPMKKRLQELEALKLKSEQQ